MKILFCLSVLFCSLTGSCQSEEGIPLYYWRSRLINYINFGDYLSLKLVERITQGKVKWFGKDPFLNKRKMIAVGSVLHLAYENDVIWGTGLNGKHLKEEDYRFTSLEVRAVRGPLTRKFLVEKLHIQCPEIYGDPVLLMPYFFPEFVRKENPSRNYIVIPHYSEEKLFPKGEDEHIVYPSEPWNKVIEKILDSKFVISSSLHGLVVADAYGIPSRMLRITENEPLFKYQDYYFGTGRPNFAFARSIKEALKLGGESPYNCDLKKLYAAFPFRYWPSIFFQQLD